MSSKSRKTTKMNDLRKLLHTQTEEGKAALERDEEKNKAALDRILEAIQAEGFDNFALCVDLPGSGSRSVGFILHSPTPAFVLRLSEAFRGVITPELLANAMLSLALCDDDDEPQDSVH